MHYLAKSYISRIVAIRKRIALLLIAGVISATSITTLFAPTASAADLVDSSAPAVATAYTWVDRQRISITGGSVKPDQVLTVLSGSDSNNPESAFGSILMTQPIKLRDCVLWVFCSDTETTWDCTLSISITFSNQLKQGTLIAKGASDGASVGNQNTTYCTDKAAAAYNGKVVSIGGTRPGDGSGTAETDDQKRTGFVISTNFTFADAPASVNIVITGTENKTISAAKRQTSTGATFEGTTTLGPGDYQADISSPPDGLTVAKESFTKVKFESLIVYLGESEGYSNRLVAVKLEISTLDPSARTYGPLPVTLYNAEGEEIASGETNSWTAEAITEGVVNEERQFNLQYNFSDVEPGSYKVCIRTDQDLCEDIEKVEGERKEVYFETTGDALLSESDIEKETSCAVDDIGWIVCGVMRGLAGVNDAIYGLVETILITAPLATTDSSGKPTPQYLVWQSIRDISNVLLVVAFLIIIFSQATSIGISSYGIKKMLPRLIIAAIAINLSFFAMQLAVDLANLLGVGLNSFTSQIADDALGAAMNEFTVTKFVDSVLGGGAAILAGGAILAVASFTPTALALFVLPFLVGAVLAVLAAFITLFLRNAIIVVLVMVAPLAFAAYLLPNTEGLFTKWRKLLTSMLLLFPMAALLFAGAKIAGYTVVAINDNPLNTFFAYIIMVLPLFMLPWLARQGGGIMKAVGDRMQGLAGKAKAPLQNALKPYVDERREAYRTGSTGFFGRQHPLDEDGNRLGKKDAKAWRKEQKRIKDWRKIGLDEGGHPIVKQPRRTLPQVLAQNRKDAEQKAKNYTELGERQYAQRAVTDPHGKTGNIMAQKEDLHLLGKAQEEEMINHQKERMNTKGTSANAYANRLEDAGVDKRKLENIQKSIQAKRVLDPTTRSTMQHGRNLAEVAKEAYTAEEVARDDELKVDHQNKRDNTVADKAIQSQKLTQEQIKGIETRQQKDYDKKKEVEGNPQYEAAKVQEFNTRESTSSNAVAKALTDKAAESDATQILAADRKFESEQLSGIVEGDEKNRQEARLGPAGDLIKLGDKKGATDLREQELNAAAEARSLVLQVDDPDVTVPNAPEDDVRKEYTDAAEGIAEARSIQRMAPGVEGLVRAAKIQADPQGELAKRLAGTKDSTGIASGISKTTAQIAGRAAQDILADQTGDTAVTREEFKEEGLDNNGFLEVLGKPRNKKGKRLPNTAPVVKKSDGSVSREGEKVSFIDQTAAIEGIAENGDYHANLIALEFSIEANKAAAAARIEAARVEEENRAAAASGNPDAIKATKDALEFAATKRKEALSYARAIAKSRLLPPYLGAEELNGLGAGTLTDTLEEIEIEKAKGGDITLKKLEGSDKDHLVHLADTLADTYSNPDEVARVNSDPEAKASLQRLLVAIDAIDSDPAYDSTSHRKPGAQKAYERMRRLITEKFGVPKVMSRSGDLEDYVRPAYVAANQKDETKAWTPEPWRIQFGDDIDATDDDPSSP